VNDLDGDVVNFFRVIQDPKSCQELQSWLTYTPYSRQIYDDAFLKESQSPVERPGSLQSGLCRGMDFGYLRKQAGRKMFTVEKRPMRSGIGISYLKYWRKYPLG